MVGWFSMISNKQDTCECGDVEIECIRFLVSNRNCQQIWVSFGVISLNLSNSGFVRIETHQKKRSTYGKYLKSMLILINKPGALNGWNFLQ